MRLALPKLRIFLCLVRLYFSPGINSSSNNFSPGRSPVNAISRSLPTSYPESQIKNSDWFSHLKHENFPALADYCCLQNQLNSLGNCHEIASDIWMGNCDRPALSNLSLESRYDTTPAAKNITETNHYKGVFAFFGCLQHQHFRNSFTSSHNASWIHRFVGGNHHKVLHIIFQCQIQQIFRPPHIVSNRFGRV